MRAPFTLAVLATVGFTAPGQEPPERRPVFPAEAELVTVDAVVIDREGVPVTGLRASDFSLSEDGVRQEIVAFEAVGPSGTGGSASLGSRGAGVAAAGLLEPRGPHPSSRAFVVVFDDLHLGAAEAVRAREAVAAFLKSTADGDRVSLVATGGASWWHARMPEGREGLMAIAARLVGHARTESAPNEPMSDYEAMSIARNGDPLVLGHVVRRWSSSAFDFSRCDVECWRNRVKAAADRISLDMERRNQETLDVLVRTLASLAAVRGRKSVLLVSGGLVHDPHLAGFRETVTEARRANASIYFVDARGLVALSSDFTAEARAPTDLQDMSLALGETSAGSEGSESLAEDTGGFSVKNRNDLATGVRAIVRESSSYYLLGYAPPERSRGAFRRIEVKVAREGVSVRARRGYYATTSRDRQRPRDAALQRALDSPFDLEGIPLRATAHVFGPRPRGEGRVLITTEVDVRALDLRDEGGCVGGHAGGASRRRATRDGRPPPRRPARRPEAPARGPGAPPPNVAADHERSDPRPGTLPGARRGGGRKQRPGGLRLSRLRHAAARGPADLDTGPERSPPRGHGPGAHRAADVRAGRRAALPFRGLRGGEGPRHRPPGREGRLRRPPGRRDPPGRRRRHAHRAGPRRDSGANGGGSSRRGPRGSVRDDGGGRGRAQRAHRRGAGAVRGGPRR